MSLKERITEKSKALVKRREIALPACGERVVICGLMTGALSEVNALGPELQGLAVICMATEDPETPGLKVWNWRDQNDRDAAAGLHVDDSALIINTHNELSGLDQSEADLLKNSARTESSSVSSPSATASSPTN